MSSPICVQAVPHVVNTVSVGARRVWNWGRRTVARAWHAAVRTATYFYQQGRAAVGMVARTVVSVAKGAVNHVMHMASAAREAVGRVARVVVNTVGTVAHAVASAVKTAWNFCTGSARGAATCLAVAASVAMIASGVGAPEGVGLLATVLFTASSVASPVSFAQTGDPMDALGAIPGVGALKDAELGASLGAKLLPKAGKEIEEGIVYLRINKGTGKLYVGQAKNGSPALSVGESDHRLN